MRYAICNELFENWAFADVCRTVRELGYTGLEIAPFTLAATAGEVTASQRVQLRQQAADAGVQNIGLHWLLAKTTGFHVNSPDPAVRAKTAGYLRELVDLCGDLGGELMVFGSPAQRKLAPGVTLEEGIRLAADTLSQITDKLAERRIRFCIEPLAPTETDFLQCAADAAKVMELVDSPNVVLHLDVKAMSAESAPIPEVIDRWIGKTGHFHANDPNLRGPGMGSVDFHPIFRALKKAEYNGWVSVEVFDFKPDPKTIARESVEYMRRVEAVC